METLAGEPTGVRELDDGSLGRITERNDVVLAEFATEWCGACRRMEPVLDSIASDTDAVVVKVDVERHLETAIEHGAQRAPTFVLFVDGRPAARLRGARTEATLRDRLAPHLG